ncbi:hypothetical protein MTO96_001544 [Rhipicephalus appendiculatus]
MSSVPGRDDDHTIPSSAPCVRRAPRTPRIGTRRSAARRRNKGKDEWTAELYKTNTARTMEDNTRRRGQCAHALGQPKKKDGDSADRCPPVASSASRSSQTPPLGIDDARTSGRRPVAGVARSCRAGAVAPAPGRDGQRQAVVAEPALQH